jgi:hypothetical protein
VDLSGVLAAFEAGGTALVRTDFSSGEAWQHLPKAWPWETAWTALFDWVSDPPPVPAA